jgi:hypothetical protein
MCPKCGGKDVVRIRWTPWGGFLGPLLFRLVRCLDCGSRHAARTKASERQVIGSYLRIVMPLVVVVGVGMVYGLVAWCGW